ncbi:MAG: hypothetical protein Q8O37_08295 [Sulfuricellaceae bacterium]|nr:hypothetical protein [Sulfuricellaceae bacterium]
MQKTTLSGINGARRFSLISYPNQNTSRKSHLFLHPSHFLVQGYQHGVKQVNLIGGSVRFH